MTALVPGGEQWHGIDDVPAGFVAGAVAVGVFDGVHLGHQQLLTRAAAVSSRHGRPPAAVTFYPHPAAVLRPEVAPALLLPLEQRVELLLRHGMGAVLVLPFTREFATLGPEEFVTDVLLRLRPGTVVVGEDFRFGARAAGDVELLRRLGARCGFDVDAVPLVTEGAHRVSSSAVRRLVTEGDVSGAARLLGRPYDLHGTVVHGERRGRDLGYPTANLDVADAGSLLLPPDGVYAGTLAWQESSGNAAEHPAAVSIGTNPTFAGTRRTVEAHVIDRSDLDLYGQRVVLRLHRHLRGMVAFGSVPELCDQMAADVDLVRRMSAAAATGGLGLTDRGDPRW